MSVHDDWWSTFFSGMVIDTVRNMYPPEWKRIEADLIEKRGRLAPGARVLDAPCGDGRIALELASRGYRVTGVDLSPDLVNDAREAARERGLDATFEVRDMRELPWPRAFDAAFCFGNSFPYFDDEGNARFLRSAREALLPAGRLILDVPTVAEAFFPHFKEYSSSWGELGGILILRKARHHPTLSRTTTEYTFLRGADVERKTASYRIYAYADLVRLLGEAGFPKVEAFGSASGDPFELGSRACYLVAERD